MSNQYNYIFLTPELLDYFFENILTNKTIEKGKIIERDVDCVILSNPYIYTYWSKLYALGHTKWHLELNREMIILWRRDTWLRTKEKREKDEAERLLYEGVLEERRDAFNRIRRGICELLGIDPNDPDNLTSVNKLAEKALEAKSQGAKDLTGVDLDKVPEFPRNVKHQVISDEKGKGYTL